MGRGSGAARGTKPDAGLARLRDDPPPGLPHVVVDGWGPLAEELVAQLRRCGVSVLGGRHAADGAELALAVRR